MAARNQAYGVDGTFAFFTNLTINTYWARTAHDGIPSDVARDTSYSGEVDYAADRYGAHAEHLYIGDRFIPDVGFVRRSDIRRIVRTASIQSATPGSEADPQAVTS